MRYCKLNGEPCEPTDENRGIWYSSSCGYWTDQWDLLITNPIPCCPKCGCPGYQTTWKEWFDGAKNYEEDNHPWYCKFLLEIKEKCFGKGFSYNEVYQKWLSDKGPRAGNE